MRPHLLLALLALPFLGMSSKPKVFIRFHTEANAQDTDIFSMAVKLENQRREARLKRVPDFSEVQIRAILPFQAADGTWGCVFQLDEMGRIRLDSLSTESRGNALVVFVGTKAGIHQVTDMVIDRPVSDGVITVPKGLTDLEMEVMKKQFKVAVAPVREKKNDPIEWTTERDRIKATSEGAAAAPSQPASAPPTKKAPPSPRKPIGSDLPRIAD